MTPQTPAVGPPNMTVFPITFYREDLFNFRRAD